jgi:hypothetical protein
MVGTRLQHDGPLGNATRPGQQGNSSVYAGQLKTIATRLKAFCDGPGQCKLLFALTSAMICNVRANDNVAVLNAQARLIMSALSIPTVDLQSAIVDKCAGPSGKLPITSCFNVSHFCPSNHSSCCEIGWQCTHWLPCVSVALLTVH